MVLLVYRILVRLLCFFVVILKVSLKTCKEEFEQMSSSSGVQGMISAFSRSKKPLICIFVILVLLLFMWPTRIHKYIKSPVTATSLDLCVDSKLQPYRKAISILNAFDVSHIEEHSYTYLPYIGNGHIGVGFYSLGQLHIKLGRTLSLPVNFYPVISINIEGLQKKEKYLITITEGIVKRFQCFQMDETCVSSTSQIFAHRSRPSLLIQEFRIHNPTSVPITLDMHQVGPSDWPDSTTEVKSAVAQNGAERKFTLVSGIVSLPEDEHKKIAVAIAAQTVPDTQSIPSGTTWKYHSITAVKYSEPFDSSVDYKYSLDTLKTDVTEEFVKALGIDDKVLAKEHIKVWDKLWKHGFTISQSRAQGALNGDKINMTIYYVLSQAQSLLHQKDQDKEKVAELEKLLYFPDHCYQGHHTLQNEKMWPDVKTMDDLKLLVTTWLITLEKNGCSTMMQAGADAIQQAMILSFGSLKFGNEHLEFVMHPRDLHRDFFFRRLSYGNNTHLNISVVVGDDNKAQLSVALDRNDKPYYACDAGCLDAPVKLSREWSLLPVKLTDPFTAILYITADQQHMGELKHAIHVRAIAEAPAHEHHVIALHRHGHHYGGLPVLFWAAIAFLIIIFHVFLFKLVFNEYCNFGETKYVRARYNV